MKRISRVPIYSLVLLLTFYAKSQDPIRYWPFDGTTGEQSSQETITTQLFTVVNQFSNPERIEGVSGNGLRFDGYSTHLQGGTSLEATDQITIDLWYATEAFSARWDNRRELNYDAAIVSQLSTSDGFSLETSPYGEVSFTFFADNQKYVITNSDRQLEKYKWNHIVATVDLPNNVANLYVNNELWRTQALNSESSLTLNSNILYIGRNVFFDTVFGISGVHVNGAIDELKIYDMAFDQSQVSSSFATFNPSDPDLIVDANVRHAGDYLRPAYHPMPNTLWTNESYGLTYYNNEYHMFFQKNPNANVLNFMHWGHLVSPDLVNWREERIVLAPDKSPGFDNFGAWSGATAFDQNGDPVIFYTGVDIGKAGIGVAFPDDPGLLGWSKYENNPVISNAPGGLLDFRDPYIWEDQGTYYMIVGSGVASENGGTLPTYKSTDLVNWTQIETLYARTNDPEVTGVFWEMPFFTKLNDQNEYVLGVTPVHKPSRDADVIYWIGKWENETFTPYFDEPKQLEFTRINHLAPAVGFDEEGRITYMGVVPETRSVDLQLASGWRQTFSLPRVMRLLEDSTLGHYPHPNLCRYRENEVSITNKTFDDNSGNFNLPEFGGNQIELSFRIKAEEDTRFTLQVLKKEDASQFSGVFLDLGKNEITFDIRNANDPTQGVFGKEEFEVTDYVFDPDEEILVQVFVDHSIVEFFIDNLLVFTGRVYPSEESTLVDLAVSSGSIEVVEGYQWHMKSLGSASGSEVCEPSSLPTSFRDPIIVDTPLGVFGNEGNAKVKVYPNPVYDTLFINLENITKELQVQIVNLQGQAVRSRLITNGNGAIDVSDLDEGIYVIRFSDGLDVTSSKIYITR